LFSLALPDQFAYYIVTPPGALERAKVRAFRDWLREEADPTPRMAGSAAARAVA
jgi:LysR family glycine cleavage system transcriptional activator